MSLNHWFEKGLTKEAYMERLDKHKQAFHHIKQTFSIPPEDEAVLKTDQKTRAIVLAAEWCGHCMLDIPIFLHIAQQANIDTRFLIRDDHLPLMEQYETNGKQYIPIIILIDENGKEINKWGPWAPEVNDFTDELKKSLPDRDSAEFDEAFQQFIQKVGTAFQTDESLWNDVYEDMKRTFFN